MANYSTYSDVEKEFYGVSGDTFSAAQQTIVTDLITKTHSQILNILGATSDPTDSNNALKSLEVEIVCIKLQNADNRHNTNYHWVNPFSRGIIERIKATATDEDDDTEEMCSLGLIRDYENYYGY